MQRNEIVTAIEKAREGICQYLEIMAMLPAINVDSDKGFQRLFNHFYRIRQRSENWYKEYYAFMERKKYNHPKFEEVLDHLYETLGRYEPSFSSKLAATLDPNEPVWDQYVIRNVGQRAPAYSSTHKMSKAKEVFQEIRNWYDKKIESAEGKMIIDIFDKLVIDHNQITAIKKIDFVLWQMRS